MMEGYGDVKNQAFHNESIENISKALTKKSETAIYLAQSQFYKNI